MGPFQDYKEKKSPEKGSPRSRIPRLVLHPSQVKEKGSPLSESPVKEKGSPLSGSPMKKGTQLFEFPLSEEEGVCSDHSKRTISTNSFCSDDTGCPTSQSVSPSKTPAGSDRSPHPSPSPPPHTPLSPPPPECRTKVKRVRVMTERDPEPHSVVQPRSKREQRSSTRLRGKGSEADFSSSSSTGSLKTRGLVGHSSTGKKICSRRSVSHIRSLPVFKLAGSPKANRDAALYAPYRTPPKAPPSSIKANRDASLYAPYRTPPKALPSSTNSSCTTSPTSSLGRGASLSGYHSLCTDNHGIRPPNPEQYLTPLQQKEVAIRHLKTQLREFKNIVHDRELEIEEMKGQLGRMREDWIEEECHRVEAQLSLKEARKEIKQLRQVVETMKSSLMEKDKGINKYFVDINIQNRKLESLLHSMELAQSGSTLDLLDSSASPDQTSPSPVKKLEGGKGVEEALETGAGVLEENHGGEEMADSGMLASDEMASGTDAGLEQVLMSTAMESMDSDRLGGRLGAGLSTLLLHSGREEEEEKREEEKREEEKREEEKRTSPFNPPVITPTIGLPVPQEKSVQTDLGSLHPDMTTLLLQLLKLPLGVVGDALLPGSDGLLGVAVSTPVSTPPPTSVSAPVTTVVSVSAPEPTLASVPAPSPTPSSVPAPSPTLSSVPAPSPTLASVSATSLTLASVSAPSPTLASVSAPSPTLASVSAPSPTLASVPAPSPTLASVPAPSPTFASVSAPSPTLASVPDTSPTLLLAPAPELTPVSVLAPATAPAQISSFFLPESPTLSSDSGQGVLYPAESPAFPATPQVFESSRFMQELDFSVREEEDWCRPAGAGMNVVGKRYWSNSFLVDLVAVAAPMLPTVAWLYSRHGVDGGGAPVYNIAALIRGCCIMGLHSLRHVTDG